MSDLKVILMRSKVGLSALAAALLVGAAAIAASVAYRDQTLSALAAAVASDAEIGVSRVGFDEVDAGGLGVALEEVNGIIEDALGGEDLGGEGESSGFDLGIVEDVVDDGYEGFAGFPDDVGAFALLRFEVTLG